MAKISKKLFYIPSIIIILLIISGCIGSDSNSITTKGKYGNIELTMQLDRTTFAVDDDINMTISLKNNGDKPVTLEGNIFDVGVTFPQGSSTEFTYLYPGSSIDDSKNITVVEPGKSLIKEILWDQTYSVSGDDGEELIIDPGEYNLQAYVKAKITDKDTNIDSYTIKTEPITINIDEN